MTRKIAHFHANGNRSGMPSPDFIALSRWSSVVKIQLPFLHEWHFMASAIRATNAPDICVNVIRAGTTQSTQPTNDLDAWRLRDIFSRSIAYSTAVFNQSAFCIFKDACNEFMILCGRENFLARAFP